MEMELNDTDIRPWSVEEVRDQFGDSLTLLPPNDNIKELQSILRDRNTTRNDFKFYADRLIRLVIEESLNKLPFTDCEGLRDCCRSIRIGKILVESDTDTHEAHVVYAKFPEDIARRQHGVKEERIILSNLFCTPAAVQAVVDYVPRMNILTAELHPVAPNHFGQKYFGTD
ncbi:Uracil phosphoribosyltransferase [Operophtera brumata]|uniref:Uracil phosphoribosyltransferase n=1 Tax=Operophtera brumata TaxID=104452 RepID=A0A0L7L5P9_OPEBR|nr:Uracil phosphoribosyltransferase [Operophtera brumata]